MAIKFSVASLHIILDPIVIIAHRPKLVTSILTIFTNKKKTQSDH